MSEGPLASPEGALGLLTLALLLGARHALDPDHLAAVSQVVLGDRGGRLRGPFSVGLWWGLGHALTLCALGLPVVLWGTALPAVVHFCGELAVGLLIVALGVRLLRRSPEAGLVPVPLAGAHTAFEDPDGRAAAARPDEAYLRSFESGARTPLTAFGVGLVHGVGGSAAVGVLAVASITGPAALATLLLFSAATALSMGGSALAFGYLVTRGPFGERMHTLLPLLAWIGIAFGLWYTASVLGLALGGG